jgi:hypothetical protein
MDNQEAAEQILKSLLSQLHSGKNQEQVAKKLASALSQAGVSESAIIRTANLLRS